jgi:hypothetical protein
VLVRRGVTIGTMIELGVGFTSRSAGPPAQRDLRVGDEAFQEKCSPDDASGCVLEWGRVLSRAHMVFDGDRD